MMKNECIYLINNENQITDRVISKKYPDLYDTIVEATKFLDECITTKIPHFSVRLYCVLNDISEVPVCPICNKKTVGLSSKKRGKLYMLKATCGGKDCHPSKLDHVKEKVITTNLEKYGAIYATCTDSVKQKVRETNRERYGSDYAMRSEELKEKYSESIQEKYGTKWYTSTDRFKENQYKSFKEQHGVDNPMQLKAVLDKQKATNKEKYGTDYYFASAQHRGEYWGISKDTRDILSNKEQLEKLYQEHKTITSLYKHFGDVSETTISRALVENDIPITYTMNKVSTGEQELSDFIRAHYDGDDIIQSDRTILDGKELDIYIPSKQIAVEFNGLFWHCSRFKDKLFHQEKALNCEKLGINLITIWEDDWTDNRNVVESMLLAKLGKQTDRVYARKTKAVEISHKTASEFLKNTHIQGETIASVWYGLFQSDELVATIGFKKTSREGEWDLVRYATSKTVVGGFSKLLTHFKNKHNFSRIITFASLDVSDGNLYEKNGFDLEYITKPSMSYIKGPKRFRRERFMKHKLNDKLENFNPNITERENMLNHGFYQLFDCGMKKYVLDNKKTPH
jgi:hypothetical protein